MADLPTVKKQYMGDGNTPPVKGGKFPVLELSDGSRIVGRAGQSYKDLRNDAADKKLIGKG